VIPEQPDDRETLRDEPVDADALAEEEAAAAAAEAAAIGGPPPDDHVDPAERPLVEAGGGVAEGFEQAEDELIRQATHEDPAVPPTEAAFSPEEESDRSTAIYGEPDEVDPTEVVADPSEGDDDPGAGPGVAPDR
jgi:hypothetical protein